MRIIVDADACPVKEEVIRVGKKNQLEVHLFADINHQISSEYGNVHIVDQGADFVDIALINEAKPGDVIITQDYGVASLAIGKGCAVIHPSGKIMDKENIDQLMFERHIAREERNRGRRGPRFKKRVKKDNQYFELQLEKLIFQDVNKV